MAIPKESLYTSKVIGPGEVYESNPINNLRSYAAEEDGLKFGRAVMLGTDPEKQVKIYGASSGTFVGVGAYSTQADDLDNSQYKQYDPVSVFDQGVVMVYVEESVEVGDTVRIRHTADGTKVAGSFATTSDAGKTVVLTGAEYRGDSVSGVVPLFLNPPFSVSAD